MFIWMYNTISFSSLIGAQMAIIDFFLYTALVSLALAWVGLVAIYVSGLRTKTAQEKQWAAHAISELSIQIICMAVLLAIVTIYVHLPL